MYIIKAQSSLVFYSNACFWLAIIKIREPTVRISLSATYWCPLNCSLSHKSLTAPFLFIKSSLCDVMIITKLRSTNKTPSRMLQAHTKYDGD